VVDALIPASTTIINANGPNWAEVVLALSSAIAALGLFYAGIQVRDARIARVLEVAAEWQFTKNGEGTTPRQLSRYNRRAQG
jgi:hypothetical protein